MMDDLMAGDLFDGELLNLDLTDVPDMGAIPPGLYPARVIEADVRNSEASGTPTLYLTLELTGPEEYVGRKLFFTNSLSQKARGFLKETIRALGFPLQCKLHPMDMVDRECAVKVINETYEGEQRSRVRRLYPPTKLSESFVAEKPQTVGDDLIGGDEDVDDGLLSF